MLITELSAAEVVKPAAPALAVSEPKTISEGSTATARAPEVATIILSFDANRVMQGYDTAKSRDEELKALADSLQKDGQKKMEELIAGREEIQKLAEKIDNPALADEARDKMKTEAEKLIEALQEKEVNFHQWQEEAESRLRDMRTQMLSKTIEEIKIIVSEIAIAKGALLVVNRTNPDILYAASTTDISEKTILRLNQRYPAPVKTVLAKTSAGDKAK
ncbi:MAG: OmpH family outer membrane protein [Puniceicoccales bacterium]|nr:OmpH family outer membrane protein [Puniceicoccales bacterium]